MVSGIKTGLDTGKTDKVGGVGRCRKSARNILTQITDGLAGVLQQLAPDFKETQSSMEGVRPGIRGVEIDLADHPLVA